MTDSPSLRRSHPRIRSGAAGLVLFALSPVWTQTVPDYELPPIAYSTTDPTNAISEVQRGQDHAQLHLKGATDRETLERCLAALGVPAESQVLVFSKTSLQRRRIEPHSPRAIYFSDDCYVGWVPGGLFEVAVTDPRLGLAFYQVDPRAVDQALRFERNADCLSCHAGSMTRQWPGLLVRSVFPDAAGEPITSAGSFLIEHDTPIRDRWGGWYVTGQHGSDRHMGNVTALETPTGAQLDRDAGANLTNLARFFAIDRYPRSGSDIVALMLLEHQVGMHNRFVEGGLRTRKWMYHQQALQRELGEPVTAEPTGTARRVIDGAAQRILEHLLWVGEAALPEGGIQGDPGFVAAFQRNRHKDDTGRSLKDLDLKTRLFVYRCSYMIYSKAFESLPEELKLTVYRRLQQVLSAPVPPKPFDHLPGSERQAIRDILRATKPGFAAVDP